MNDLIQPLDIAGSYGRGRVSYEIGQEAERRNALQAFMADNGQALMSGDQNALSGLMQFDPQMALGLQRQGQQDALQREQMDLSRQQAQHGMANDSARLELARAEGKRQAEAFAVQLDDRKRAELAEKAKKASETALVAYKQGPEAWDRWNDSNPEFENVAYEDAPIKISTALGALEALMPQAVEPMSPEGKLAHDVNAGLVAQPGPQPLSPEGKLATDVKAGIVDPNAAKPYDFEAEEDLRKEYTALGPVKSFQVQADAFGKVAAAAKDPTAAGDLALIFSFMKILDPNSVVREQEFANAQNAAGVPDQVRNAWNRALNGERLNPDQRADFLRTAYATYQQSEAQVKAIAGQYGGIADERGLARNRAIPNFGYAGEVPDFGAAPAAAASAGPAQITTVDEYNALPSGAEYIDPNGKHKVKR